MAEEYVYAPFDIRADATKPARIVQDKEGKLYLEYYDLDGELRRVPITLVLFPQELGDLASQIPITDTFQKLRVVHVGSDIMLPVDIQDQYVVVAVRETEDMLATSASLSIAAGATDNVDIAVPAGELWEVTYTNHIGSDADISLNYIAVSPDGGTTFYPVSAAHISAGQVYVSEGNVIRGNFTNAGAVAETAVLNVVGRKLKVSV
jgi:hypothetical protein